MKIVNFRLLTPVKQTKPSSKLQQTLKFLGTFLVLPVGGLLSFTLIALVVDIPPVTQIFTGNPFLTKVCQILNKPGCVNTDSLPQYLVYDPTGVYLRKSISSQEEVINLKQKINDYQKQLSQNNQEASAWTNLGEALRRTGDLENARRNHKKALAIEHNFNPALIGLALVEAQMKNYPAANAAIEQAINIEPDRAISYIYQAEIRLLQDDRQGAEQALTKAKQLAPSYDTAITNLSGLLAW